MKNQLTVFIIFLCTIATPVFSQVKIGVDISVNIDLPTPRDIVIIDERPQRTPVPQPRPQPRPRPRTTPRANLNFGELQNQNGPVGRQIYTVTFAQLETLNNGVEVITYRLNSGDILELFIVTANSNDYNYHSYGNDCVCQENNKIIKVLFNGQYLALRDGSLSLQPGNNNSFHSVINLHSLYEGDFNGTVNF